VLTVRGATAQNDVGEFKVVGRVLSLVEVEVNSPLYSNLKARVEEVLVEEGDYVLKDQLIARLDSREPYIQFKQFERKKNDLSAIKEADRSMREAQRRYEQAKELHEKGASSKEEAEQLKFLVEKWAIGVESAKEQNELDKLSYDLWKRRLQDYDICAPIAGVIAERYVDVGEMLGGTSVGEDRVALLISIDEVFVQADVDVQYLTEVEEGDKVTVLLHHPKKKLEGVVYYVSPVVDPAANTFIVKVKVKNQVLSEEKPRTVKVRKILKDGSVKFVDTEVRNRKYLIRPGVYADVIFKLKPRAPKQQ